MARFNFREGFFLNLGGDILSPDRIRFEAGEQDVPDALADHWFLAEMGERIDGSAAPVETIAEIDEKDALRTEAASLGVTIDKRWGADRLRAEIEAKKSSVEPAPTEPVMDLATAPDGQPEPEAPVETAPEPEATI